MRLLNLKNESDEVIINMNRRNLILTNLNRTSTRKPLIPEIELSAADNPLDYLLLSTDNRAMEMDVSSYTTSNKN